MFREEERPTAAELEQVNAVLKSSLGKCRELLTDCRTKLAANGNEPDRAQGRRNSRA